MTMAASTAHWASIRAAAAADLAIVVPVAETVDREVRAVMASIPPEVVLIPASAGATEKHRRVSDWRSVSEW